MTELSEILNMDPAERVAYGTARGLPVFATPADRIAAAEGRPHVFCTLDDDGLIVYNDSDQIDARDVLTETLRGILDWLGVQIGTPEGLTEADLRQQTETLIEGLANARIDLVPRRRPSDDVVDAEIVEEPRPGYRACMAHGAVVVGPVYHQHVCAQQLGHHRDGTPHRCQMGMTDGTGICGYEWDSAGTRPRRA